MSTIIFRLLLLLLICFDISLLFGQAKNHFIRVEKEDGSQLGHIFDTFEDDLGFIWFCTHNGLIRYDGYEIKPYLSDEKDPESLSNSWIFDGICDSQGSIWAATSHGLNQMDRKTGKCKRYFSIQDSISSIPHSSIRGVFEDKTGRIWVSTMGGVCYYNRSKDSFVRLKSNGFKAYRHGGKFYQMTDGTLFVTSLKNLFKINVDSLSLEPVFDYQKYNLNEIHTRVICQADDESIFIASSSGMVRYNFKNDNLKQLNIEKVESTRSFSSVIKIDEFRYLFGANGTGLYLWDDRKQKAIRHWERNPFDRNGLLVNSIYSLFKDSNENYWIGTFNGVNKVNLDEKEMQLYLNVDDPENFKNYILKVYGGPNGQVWVNTMEGVFHRKNLDSPATPIYNKHLLKDKYNGVGSFATDQNGVTWMAIRSKGLIGILPDLKTTVEAHAFNKFKIGMNYMKVITDRFNPDILWVTSQHGVYQYNKKNDNGRMFPPKKEVATATSNQTFGLVQDAIGNVWTAGGQGLYVIDHITNKYTYYPMPKEEGKVSNVVKAIDGLADTIYVATVNAIHKLVHPDGIVESYTRSEGVGNKIISMEVDKNGDVWIGEENGLVKYDMSLGKSLKYGLANKTEGLVIGYSGEMEDGTILFPDGAGIIAFHPDQLVLDTMPPKLYLSEVKVNNENLDLNESVEFNDKFTLHWSDKMISFKYVGLKYRNSDKVKYKIKLEGFDEKWRDMDRKREVSYTNLNPGNYVFNVKASNSNGVWSTNPLQVQLEVLAPYWKTNWFYLLIALIGLFLIILVIKYIGFTRKLSRDKEIAEKNAKYKSLFLANMSHEIRTPMNAILGMSRLIENTNLNKQQLEYAGIIRESAENLLTIINDVLDQSKIESGKYSIIHKPFELDVLLHQLHKLFQQKASEKGLDFELKIDESIPKILTGDVIRLNQILTNLLGNAIKFTDQGKIKLQIAQNNHSADQIELLFQVKDTGRGIPIEMQERIFESFERVMDMSQIAKPGTGLGLAIAKQLIEIQGGKIWLESTPGKGTTFFFTLEYPIYKVKNQQQIISSDETKNEHISFSILLVEDTFFNQRLAIELLRKKYHNISIDVAENGQIALEKIKKQDYDLVLMDVKMPVMDGLTAARKIRELKDPKISKIPIIAVTANAIPEQLGECKKVGMNDYITKPINSLELYQKIDFYINIEDHGG